MNILNSLDMAKKRPGREAEAVTKSMDSRFDCQRGKCPGGVSSYLGLNLTVKREFCDEYRAKRRYFSAVPTIIHQIWEYMDVFIFSA